MNEYKGRGPRRARGEGPKPGDVFGKLTIFGFMPRLPWKGKGTGIRRVVAKCECGKFTTPWETNVLTGRTRSCGCGQANRRGGVSPYLVSSRSLIDVTDMDERIEVGRVQL